MPFSGGVVIIVNGGGGGSGPDINPPDGIVDESNRITLDGVTVEPQEVKQAEADIIDLENNKLGKTDPLEGGGF